MEIRKRLTLQFTIIVAVILFLAELSIFIFSELKWKEDFNSRLQSKATAVTKLLLDVEGVDADILRLIEKNNLSTMPFEEIHIFNNANEEIFSSRDSSNLLITPEMLELIRVNKYIDPVQGRYTLVGFEYFGIKDRIIVVAGAIDIYGLRKLTNLRNILIIVFMVSLLILYLSGRLFSNRALRPILKVIHEVPAITESTLHLRVDEGNGRDEIARLAQTFNKMLERLEAVFKVQQSFIANASHEIRTPLAHISGQMEVALLKERTREEYVTLISNVLEDIINLGNTANRLLLLTMANSESYQIPKDTVRMDELLWEAHAELIKTHPTYRVTIQFQEDFEGDSETEQLLSVIGNDQLLRIVILNLMENGCKYSAGHRVQITLEHPNQLIRIRFSDQGVGIPIEEQELVFEPFYRGKNVASVQGSGLGLSLVRRITQLHGGTITLRSVPGEGSEFILEIPILFEEFNL
ncbi:MAG: HAMP domain-containing histidine kinase [Bacteroidales bacterium]|nr:HAMP domain-containing histidine kinase [Bacteroidales bacterium]